MRAVFEGLHTLLLPALCCSAPIADSPCLHCLIQLVAQVVEALQRGASNEALVCVAGYVLGEYGRQLQPEVPIQAQFMMLQDRFVSVSPEAKVCCCCLRSVCLCEIAC